MNVTASRSLINEPRPTPEQQRVNVTASCLRVNNLLAKVDNHTQLLTHFVYVSTNCESRVNDNA